jgi:hypothetical protein
MTAWLGRIGQNRDVFGNLESQFRSEAQKRAGRGMRSTCGPRPRRHLDAGAIRSDRPHAPPVAGRALTLGYVRDVVNRSFGSIGIGGDVTGYPCPTTQESHGLAVVVSCLLRYHGRFGAHVEHRH